MNTLRKVSIALLAVATATVAITYTLLKHAGFWDAWSGLSLVFFIVPVFGVWFGGLAGYFNAETNANKARAGLAVGAICFGIFLLMNALILIL